MTLSAELRHCPALFIAAPASGQGKTTVTAALARLHTRQGRRVRVFKCGPDFLDPQIHAFASGAPAYNVDLGMCGEEDAAWRLAQAADEADLILIEGVMGLYDGEPSGADLACRFGIPVMAVIDARAMAQTIAAVAHGLASFRKDLPFAGVLANHVGSPQHAELLRQALPPDIPWFGALLRDEEVCLPERHLGLFQAAEISDLENRLDRLADSLEQTQTRIAGLPPATGFSVAAPPAVPLLLKGRTIAIARDAAYSFIYPANLDTLHALGAELRFFSPLAGDVLPECDAVWLPGGYPEIFGRHLSGNPAFFEALRAHVACRKPLLAEGGGMMSLFDTVIDRDGFVYDFAGIIPGRAVMQKRLVTIGVQAAIFAEGILTGHAFHFSRSETTCAPLLHAYAQKEGREGEAVFRIERTTASYMHFYFPSNPEVAAAFFAA